MTGQRPPGSVYPGNEEARALSAALRASGGWTPCEGQEPSQIDPALCSGCPVRAACGDYGRAARLSGTFGGVRMTAPNLYRH